MSITPSILSLPNTAYITCHKLSCDVDYSDDAISVINAAKSLAGFFDGEIIKEDNSILYEGIRETKYLL